MRSEYAVSILSVADDLHIEVVQANSAFEAEGIALNRYKGIPIKSWISTWVRDIPRPDRVEFTAYGQTGSVDELTKAHNVALQSATPWLAVGLRINAIKEVRAVTGWGLREAKRFVDRIVEDDPKLLGSIR